MNKKGVSLIELIAVIVILGIIATVGGISLSSVIKKSQSSTCKSHLQDIESSYFHNHFFHYTDELNEDDLAIALSGYEKIDNLV